MEQNTKTVGKTTTDSAGVTETLPSKEDFEAYEGVRVSGVTNMFMVTTVCELSGLDKKTVMAVMKNYGKLSELYPEVSA